MTAKESGKRGSKNAGGREEDREADREAPGVGGRRAGMCLRAYEDSIISAEDVASS